MYLRSRLNPILKKNYGPQISTSDDKVLKPRY